MRIIVAIACVFALITPAAAQYGVSNARDGNGNLVRDNGMNPSRNYGQAPVNNVNNAVNRAAPLPPTNTKSTKTTR
jgi:hypothetical protein